MIKLRMLCEWEVQLEELLPLVLERRQSQVANFLKDIYLDGLWNNTLE